MIFPTHSSILVFSSKKGSQGVPDKLFYRCFLNNNPVSTAADPKSAVCRRLPEQEPPREQQPHGTGRTAWWQIIPDHIVKALYSLITSGTADKHFPNSTYSEPTEPCCCAEYSRLLLASKWCPNLHSQLRAMGQGEIRAKWDKAHWWHLMCCGWVRGLGRGQRPKVGLWLRLLLCQEGDWGRCAGLQQ